MTVTNMRSRRLTIAVLGCALLVAACDGSLPSVRGVGLTVPSLTPPGAGGIRRIPSIDAKSLEDGDETSGRCERWVTEIDTYSRRSGDFERLERCLSGGEIETIHTVGNQELDGSGHYATTYTYRDGHQVVWQYSFQPDPADPNTTSYVASSDAGESFQGQYRSLENGATHASETWDLVDGTYQIEGVYEADNRFNGSVTFDDPTTEQSPDWILDNQEDLDGTVTQQVTTYVANWQLHESVVVAPDGSYGFSFGYDDTRTEVSPDYRGGYQFDAAGAGSGGYHQYYEDGSTLEVEQQIASDGSFDQRWWFDDANTDQRVDQEGAAHYNADGSGSGTVITHVVDGGTETCDLSVSADGATSIDNCR